MSRVPKTILWFDDLLESLTGPRKAAMLRLMIYYSKKIQMKVSKGKGT